jgi:hypothetical protein
MRIVRLLLFSAFLALLLSGCNKKIDRYTLVTRHNIRNSLKDSLNSLTVGNGKFAFTADITGLQTFPGFYSKGIPLGTMSEWGWDTAENPDSFSLDDVYRTYNVHGRPVEYVHQYRTGEDQYKVKASDWLRANPLRIHLGFIGFQILKRDGTEISIDDIENNVQNLNLWTGELESSFTVEGVPVRVRTVCHPLNDVISASVESPLIKENRLKVRLRFPFTNPLSFGFDLTSAGKHSTSLLSSDGNGTLLERKLNTSGYQVNISHPGSSLSEEGDHSFLIEPNRTSSTFGFSCLFTHKNRDPLPESFEEVRSLVATSWEEFWTKGGAVDFSQCTDPIAPELERRVILSQYLTKVQCSGSFPPAETGLTYNSWFGKFHLEMHWWHGVHFALWNRAEVLEKQMNYYFTIFDNAKNTARKQGYDGVRWPKMTSPEGMESPSTVGTYLIWQQPHPIFYAELLYGNAGNKQAVLDRYKEIVFSTAGFMASYAILDTINDRYVLGPVLIPAQESLNKETTINPVFELAYWYWGLKTAREWKNRLGLDPVPLWNDIIEKISDLPVQDGLYLCSEDTKDSYTNQRYMSDHPIVSGVLGLLPETKMVDKQILGSSLDTIMKKWNWRSTWGWDFPMLAMSAAAIGRSEQAVGFLMMEAPKNRYLLNGHNYQDARLALYLPGNGGLLTAVAKMCVEDQFPHNGKWRIKWENLNRYVE